MTTRRNQAKAKPRHNQEETLASQKRNHLRTATGGILLVSAAVLLAACGSTSSPSSSSTSKSGSGITTNAAARKLLPASVKSSGTLVIASDAQVPPFVFTLNGSYSGSTYQLEKGIAKELGLHLQVINTAFPNLITTLQSARADASMGDLTDTPVREQVVTMIDYEKTDHRVIVQKGNPLHITGPAGLCGKSAGSSQGGLDAVLAQDESAVCVKNGKAPITLKEYSNTTGAVLALEAGRIDAIIEEDQPGAYVAKQAKTVEQVGPGISPGLHGIAVLKSNTQLVKAIQTALQALVDSGYYGHVLKSGGASATALKQITVNKGTLPGLSQVTLSS